MDVIQAIVLGLVQGLTEFLPVSSSGHLRLVPALLGWQDPGSGFSAAIQIGTLLAVLIYFRRELLAMTGAFFKGLTGAEHRKSRDWKLAIGVIVGTLPIIVVGLSLEGAIDTWLRDLRITAAALAVFGIIMWAADRWGPQSRGEEEAGMKDLLIMGLWQCLALIPGVSRSGSTITGGRFSGLTREAAARISFLLSVPSVMLSGGYKLLKEREVLLESGLAATLIATAVAFVSGYAAIAWLIALLKKRSLTGFMVYRVLLAAAIFILVGMGILDPGAGAP
jgi:undecaprenyl-diphosphatase